MVSSKDTLPKASVLIAAKNEEDTIADCIGAIISQDYPEDKMEVILADGCSRDNTVRIAQEIAKHSRIPIKILKNEKVIPSSGWNTGIKASSGDVIFIVSAHSFIQKSYVQTCINYLNKTGAENVGGPMRARGTGYVGKAVEFAHHSPFGLGGGKFHNKNYSGFVDTVYLGAWPRTVFDKVGMFDERLVRNLDIEFNARINKNGGKIYLTPDIQSYYNCRNSLKGLWKQNFENGKWIVYTKKIAPHCFSLRHFIPLLFVVSLLTSLLLIPYSTALFLLIAGSYVLANFFFSALLSFHKGIQYFLILPVVFAALHLSYGLGSMWGIVTLKKWVAKNS